MVWYLATNDVTVTAEEEQANFEKIIRLSSSYDVGTVHGRIHMPSH
jgi:hypothetical protein